MRPPIYFLIPRQHRPPGGLPQTVEALWPWLASRGKRGVGPWVWTLQTYLHLRGSGVECELADALPRKGIVVAHRDFLPEAVRPGRELFLVCILADREAPTAWGSGRHPYAQLHVVQNPKDPLLTNPHKLWEGYYLPFWTQPGLLPRAAARRDRFEHVAFVGSNPAPELSSSRWETGLKELGLTWHVVPVQQWHDYREIDVVVAVSVSLHSTPARTRGRGTHRDRWAMRRKEGYGIRYSCRGQLGKGRFAGRVLHRW